jgi:hypothetical protein
MSAAKFANAKWRKSNLSGDTGCVEVAFIDGTIGVRDSKLGDGSPILEFSPHEWDVFIQAAGTGEFTYPS